MNTFIKKNHVLQGLSRNYGKRDQPKSAVDVEYG